MITIPDLQMALIDLLYEIQNTDINPIIGGGFGIYLKAGYLVNEYFSDLDRFGMIRMRESPYYRPELQLEEFMSALRELFPGRYD